MSRILLLKIALLAILNPHIYSKYMPASTFYLHQFCNDFDQYCENVRDWDLDFRQLEPGLFSSERLSFGNARFIFSHTKLGRSLLQRGTTPPGLVTFGLLANPGIKINWRNVNINGDYLFIFPPDGELYGITRSDFNVYPLSVSEQKLNQICSLLELPEFRVLIKNKEVFLCNPQKLFELRKYLQQVEYHLLAEPKPSRNILLLKEIEDVITVRLVRLLAEHNQPARRKPIRKRDTAIRIAETYIRENSSTTLSIPELCRAANASQRMLEYAFRERYNLTPKAFIQTFRLNSVRRQLKKANPSTDRITQIAQQQGFSHMGHFCYYYKKLFLETPTDTLRK